MPTTAVAGSAASGARPSSAASGRLSSSSLAGSISAPPRSTRSGRRRSPSRPEDLAQMPSRDFPEYYTPLDHDASFSAVVGSCPVSNSRTKLEPDVQFARIGKGAAWGPQYQRTMDRAGTRKRLASCLEQLLPDAAAQVGEEPPENIVVALEKRARAKRQKLEDEMYRLPHLQRSPSPPASSIDMAATLAIPRSYIDIASNPASRFSLRDARMERLVETDATKLLEGEKGLILAIGRLRNHLRLHNRRHLPDYDGDDDGALGEPGPSGNGAGVGANGSGGVGMGASAGASTSVNGVGAANGTASGAAAANGARAAPPEHGGMANGGTHPEVKLEEDEDEENRLEPMPYHYQENNVANMTYAFKKCLPTNSEWGFEFKPIKKGTVIAHPRVAAGRRDAAANEDVKVRPRLPGPGDREGEDVGSPPPPRPAGMAAEAFDDDESDFVPPEMDMSPIHRLFVSPHGLEFRGWWKPPGWYAPKRSDPPLRFSYNLDPTDQQLSVDEALARLGTVLSDCIKYKERLEEIRQRVSDIARVRKRLWKTVQYRANGELDRIKADQAAAAAAAAQGSAEQQGDAASAGGDGAAPPK